MQTSLSSNAPRSTTCFCLHVGIKVIHCHSCTVNVVLFVLVLLLKWDCIHIILAGLELALQTKASFKLVAILLSLSPECWNYRCPSPCPVLILFHSVKKDGNLAECGCSCNWPNWPQIPFISPCCHLQVIKSLILGSFVISSLVYGHHFLQPIQAWVEDLVQWLSACLECTEHWVFEPQHQRREKNNLLHSQAWGTCLLFYH